MDPSGGGSTTQSHEEPFQFWKAIIMLSTSDSFRKSILLTMVLVAGSGVSCSESGGSSQSDRIATFEMEGPALTRISGSEQSGGPARIVSFRIVNNGSVELKDAEVVATLVMSDNSRHREERFLNEWKPDQAVKFSIGDIRLPQKIELSGTCTVDGRPKNLAMTFRIRQPD